jgi:hypothetical protein
MLCALYTFSDWYHVLMKLFGVLALVAALLPAAVNPQLRQVNTVYILAMSGGMDQYLASSLTSMGVFQVVTDPLKADAIVTDKLGETFEGKLKELYDPPPAESKEKDEKNNGFGAGTFRVGSTGRGRGNVFIVDRKSRGVLWSAYDPPKDSSTGEMSKTAQRIAKKLKTDLATNEH